MFTHFAKAAVHGTRGAAEYSFAAVRSTRDQEQRQADAILAFLLRMGPIYIKIGQIAATRSDLLPESWVDTLRVLQDRTPHMDAAQTRRAIERELGAPLETAFRAFDTVPIASASVAQVHTAELHDGRKVAVKLVKDAVPGQIEESLRALGALVKVVHAVAPPVRNLNLPKRFEEVARLLRPQADMTLEAGKQQRIHANLRAHPFVRVPEVLPELVTRRMLVMEFIDAVPGKHADTVPFPRERLAQRLQDTIYTMLYMHGLCHGDPHPGNVMFTPTGELVLLDYGITVELSEDEKWGLSSFYYACTRKEWSIAVDRFTRHFVSAGSELHSRRAEYDAEMIDVLRYHFDVSTNRWSTIAYFNDVNAVLRKYDSRYTTNFTKVELVFLSGEGFATQIDPNIDIWANARKFTDRYSPYMSAEVEGRFTKDFHEQMPTSLAMRDRADASLVAPTHIDRYFFPSGFPVFAEAASGGSIRDFDGNEYIDLSGGYGPHLLGYAHPAINAAIAGGLERGLINGIGNTAELELAELLVDAFPAAERAVLCNSGTEAILFALRMCRGYRRRTMVAKFEGHYHGFSDQGLISSWFRFSGDRDRPNPVAGTLGTDPAAVEGTLVLQYGDIPGLARLREHADDLACVILEPMPTSVVALHVEFLAELRRVCTELGIPLIFDEVVSGFRVAYGGVQVMTGIHPDLTCLGKVIGGGLPVGAVIGRREFIDTAKSSQDPFYDYENKVFAGGTLSGNSLTCTAGLAALHHLRDNPDIYRRLDANTEHLATQLREATADREIPCRISARNSIFSLNFTHREAGLYRDRMAGSNFKATIALAYYMRKHQVYMAEMHSFLISAAHTPEDLDQVARAFGKSLDEMLADQMFTV
ncbi:aminotransferase class III-fold pyridoxal phosphate-dependent enzyme [Nocardia sp. 2]|uniref:Aminotransferase class III-fold pyridoxal phosphate-dependent enzyme n=1 Tax=Nocardia acididurans TaxID=2802282 RepID=A0ABS1M5F7_9NOCA|nr:aminotransferase class III-fold pyridoxal phosphate-dependent enzyme [Nocardia acididurans]MBL1075888.1 aminotransferase class III-fold pyridoxal phosphate-dependent enzyme [Nocardia acididurans]